MLRDGFSLVPALRLCLSDDMEALILIIPKLIALLEGAHAEQSSCDL